MYRHPETNPHFIRPHSSQYDVPLQHQGQQSRPSGPRDPSPRLQTRQPRPSGSRQDKKPVPVIHPDASRPPNQQHVPLSTVQPQHERRQKSSDTTHQPGLSEQRRGKKFMPVNDPVIHPEESRPPNQQHVPPFTVQPQDERRQKSSDTTHQPGPSEQRRGRKFMPFNRPDESRTPDQTNVQLNHPRPHNLLVPLATNRAEPPNGPWFTRPGIQNPPQDRHHVPLITHQPQNEHSRLPNALTPPDSNQQDSQNGPWFTRPLRTQNQDISGPHRESRNLRSPPPKRTNPLAWPAAVCCAIFWFALILIGLIVLVVYILYRPKSPHLDISSATLTAAYLDMGTLLNANLKFLANFTNPSKKGRVHFNYVTFDLYFGKTLIATKFIPPFSVGEVESRFRTIDLVSSQVLLHENKEMAKEIEDNQVVFQIKGNYRARSNFGSLLRYKYWLYSHCTIIVTGPPNGILKFSKCRTKH